MKLAVIGAKGRMGRALIEEIAKTDGVTLAGATEAPGDPDLGRDLGEALGMGALGVPLTEDPLELITKVDGLLDFTAPTVSLAMARLAAQARIVHVIGTTGLTPSDIETLKIAARHATIIQSGNMSLGVNLLAALSEQAAAALGDIWDIEVVEMHHRHKVDAPSGTALMLGEAAAKGRGVTLADHKASGRDGITGPRKTGDIGFAALRGGGVIGDHTVIFASENERIELTHRAGDRSLFASGALTAAKWGRGRGPGFYSMKDVLGL